MDLHTLKVVGVYEYIANYYYEMSKEEMKKIATEMIWQLEQSKGNYEKANKETIKVLEEEEEE